MSGIHSRRLLLARLRLTRLSPLGWLRALIGMRAFARSQRQVTRLDPHMLRDIGLSQAEAEDIAAQPVWDAPAHWRR
jgi:uncharacterized protein YjiS (DUF1127 family)